MARRSILGLVSARSIPVKSLVLALTSPIFVFILGCEPVPPLPSKLNNLGQSSEEVKYSTEFESQLSLAVFPLVNLGPNSTESWIGPTLTELLISDLSHWPKLNVVSRRALNAILREQWFQYQSSDPEELVRLGRIRGGEIVLHGGFFQQGDLVTVDVKLIDVETGIVTGTVRAQKNVTELPVLEQTLVRGIVEHLDEFSAIVRHRRSLKDEASMEQSFDRVAPSSLEGSPLKGGVDSRPVFPEEAFGNLQKLTQRRLEQMRFAQEFYEKILTVEMGSPRYHIEESSEKLGRRVPVIKIPFSVFVELDRVQNLIANMGMDEFDGQIVIEHGALIIKKDKISNGDSFLLEQLLAPRRLFVRARSTQGEVLAVFSEFLWRTDRSMIEEDNRRVVIPIWPSPLLSGTAEFFVNWVQRDESTVTFDTVFAGAKPKEANITVEWVDPMEPMNLSPEVLETREFIIRKLQHLIQENWRPPISETLPLNDYLPSNKRSGRFLVRVVDGRVEGVRIIGTSSDYFFDKSLEQIKNYLNERCLWCQTEDFPSELPKTIDLRVQCTLMKDIRETSLGVRLP